MRLHQTVLLFLTILTFSRQHEIVKRETNEKRVVCYYTNWSVYRPGTAKFNPQNINPYLCTHLIYAFGGLDRENGLRPYDKYQDIEQGGYAKFTGLKTYNKALKTMLAIGGWNEGSARFSPLVADEERRKEFVKNVVKFLRVNHFDGLDLDWEYPAFRDGGKPRDKDNYAQLVQEIREEFERESSKTGRVRLLLTMAVPAGIEYIDKGYDIPKLNKYLDFMNILSYDYHSAFEPSVNHHSPLYSLEEESEYNFDSQLTIDATVKHYLMKGADADKLVLGIPTYGRSYTLFNEDSTDLGSPADGPGEQGDATREKGYLAYYEICAKVNDGWYVEHPKESAMGPYAFKGKQWVGYDDENIVKKKSIYVNERQLGGIMFWSIDNDDFRGNCHKRAYPLIEAAKEALFGKGGPSATKSTSSSSSSSGSRLSKTGSSKSNKLKNHRTTTVAPTKATPTVTTPDPPTTPDPGSDFVCKDEGFFPHPRDCKKYFWCLDSGPSNLGIVAHQFTCPSGLFFNKAADSCDFARNVICKKKSTTTTTTTAPTKATTSPGKQTTTIRTTTTTTTTTTEPPLEEEDDYEEDSEEDPQTIKQLINLIKKLGGVAELEKQLEGNSETTSSPISKSLYDRVISKGPPKYQTFQRNGPSGPQNEGLPRETARSPYSRKDKPQYVTIRRERPSTTTESLNSAEYADDVYEVDEPEEVHVHEAPRPKYKSIQRSNSNRDNVGSRDNDRPKAERHFKPKYQTIERFRSKQQQSQYNEEEEEENEDEENLPEKGPSTRSSTLKYNNLIRSRATSVSDPTSSTSKYVTLHRQRPAQTEETATTENDLVEEDDVTEDQQTPEHQQQTAPTSTTTTTTRPRVKIGRVRRPYSKRKISRGTTTTTTTTTSSPQEASTTSRQRTTAHSLRQRLNKFKVDKTLPRPGVVSTPIGEGNRTVIRQRKTEFRRVIRPITSTQSAAEDSQLGESFSRTISKDNNFDNVKTYSQTPQTSSLYDISEEPITSVVTDILVDEAVDDQVTEIDRPTASGEDSSAVTSDINETGELEKSSKLPDLASPAVAAIQSLATSAPTESTERYKTTLVSTHLPPKELLSTTIKHRPLRPQPRPFRPSTTTPIITTKIRPSTPKSFTRTPTHHQNHQQQTTRIITSSSPPAGSRTPHRSSIIYEDYDADYYAEPVDVPLSGKVRIHGDGYIECLDIGNFPHPFSCRKFISCAKMENGRLLGWEYTCPKGLSFDPIGGICNWNAGLGCKE